MPCIDPQHVRRVVSDLAAALDRDDFIEAARFLATDCIYEIGDETRIGSAAILASYAGSSTWGREHFDLRYESEVGEPEGDTVAVTYVDHLTLAEHHHTYRCRQHLTVGPEGRVTRIVHEELPGEREKLDQFFQECGVEKR